MALKLITAPAEEPISIAEVKRHLRVDIEDDDVLIMQLITAVRTHVEQHILRRALVTQTWDYYLDAFPASNQIVIPMPSLQSVTSISYTDANDVTSTLDASSYVVDTVNEPGRVMLKASASWPSTTLAPLNGVAIRFVAGYGLAAAVPQMIKQAILLTIGDLYENRENIVVGTIVTELPIGAKLLLWPYRVLTWAGNP